MLMQRVLRYLDKNKVEYRAFREESMADFIVETKGLVWECALKALEKRKALVVHSILLESVPEQRFSEMALFLASLNQSMVFGNFELDTRSGEVRFKTYLDGQTSEITTAAIERNLVLHVKTMKKNLPKIQSILNKAQPIRARA